MTGLTRALICMAAAASASCDVFGLGDSCSTPITGVYDLVSFQGETVPATFEGEFCAFFSCSSVSHNILEGELLLFENGGFEESGRSDTFLQRRIGTWEARGKSKILFTYDVSGEVEGQSPGPYDGTCAQRTITLESRVQPFFFLLDNSPTRTYEKR